MGDREQGTRALFVELEDGRDTVRLRLGGVLSAGDVHALIDRLHELPVASVVLDLARLEKTSDAALGLLASLSQARLPRVRFAGASPHAERILRAFGAPTDAAPAPVAVRLAATAPAAA